MAVNVKMGVDTSSFKSNIQEATAQLKTFDAQLKYAEATMKATGNAEQGLTTKMNALTGKLETQKRVAQQYWQQMEKMKSAGVDPLSKEYQKLATALLNVQTSIVETEAALNGLDKSQTEAAESADKLTQNVSAIGKKISLDQVISGINSITSGLERAAKRAVDFGKQLFDVIMDSAKRASDIDMVAEMYDIPVQRYKQMLALEAEGLKTSTDAILSAQSKLSRGFGSDNQTALDYIKELKVGIREGILEDHTSWHNKSPEKLFWDIGQAIMKVADASKQEAMATTLLGKSWRELAPLFNTYKSLEEYNAALETMNVSSEEATKNADEMGDRISALENTWTQLKDEIVGAVAPQIAGAADSLNGVLTSVLEYLQKPEGQEMLKKLGDAISGLFADLSKIDPEGVVKGFTEAFTAVTGGIQWLVDNADVAKGILGTIVTAWGTLTIGENVLKIFKFIDGIQGLATGGGAEAGAAAGTSWGTAFAGAVAKAAPWLIGLYTLLNPADTESNDLVDANGNLTAEGQMVMEQEAAREEKLAARTPREVWRDEMAHGLRGTQFWAFGANELGGNPYYKALQDYWDKYRTSTATNEDWADIQRIFEADKNGNLWNDFLKMAKVMYNLDSAVEDIPDEAFGYTDNFEEWLKEYEKGIPIDVEPVVDENAAGEISKSIGTVYIPVAFVDGHGYEIDPSSLGGDNGTGFANGLPWVTHDGLYLLHKGERVTPASMSRSYSANSNLYVENMNMNNGMDAQALAAAMSAQNRRVAAGFGS